MKTIRHPGGHCKSRTVLAFRTLCSPSPLPSLSGRGSIIGSPFDNPSRLELSQRRLWFSLSLRERAGVRGNGSWKGQTAGVLQLAPEFGCEERHCREKAA